MPTLPLTDLLAALPWPVAPPAANPTITGITSDSRAVQPGTLFVAYRGVKVDAHRFIADACARGAVAVVGDAPAHEMPADLLYTQTPDGRAALGYLLAAWHGHPSRRMTVIGVTGTDGKTTTTSLIAAILRAAGHKVSVITSVNAVIGDRTQDTGLHTTTPPAPEVQQYLTEMVDAGTTHCVLETTSEGLAQHRVAGVDYDVAVLTNITHDHLYAHGGTLEGYIAAKSLLFTGLEQSARKPGVPKVAILNADDTHYARLSAATEFLPARGDVRLAYGLHATADLSAQNAQAGADGTRFTLVSPYGTGALATPLIGAYNVSNVLAAAGATLALGIPFEALRAGVAAVQAIPGRMEFIENTRGLTVIVDFAHTAFALAQALQTGRLFVQPGGRLIAVFGAAGERDVAKRPHMGAAAGRYADLVVLTAEDPRSEQAETIIDALAEGALAEGKRDGETLWRVARRDAAIQHAVQIARAGDVIMVCGKGHEQSMAYGMIEHPWDDRVAVRAALAAPC